MLTEAKLHYLSHRGSLVDSQLFIQTVILLIVLAAVVFIILSIRELTNNEQFDNIDDTKYLKNDVDNNSRTLTHSNIFHSVIDIKDDSEK